MKKHTFLFFIAALAATPVLSAQDTLTVNNPSKVTVVSTPKSQQVEIFGSAEDPNYYFTTSIEAGPNAVVRTRERLSQGGFDFSLPLFGSDDAAKKSRRPYGEVDLAIGLGFGISFPNKIDDAAYSPMRQAWGLDFTLGLLNAEFHPWGGKSNIYMIFGLEDKSFKIRGDQRYVKGDDGVLGFAPYDGTPKWSALRIFSWNLSAGYYQCIYRDFGVFVEPILNFNTSSRIKTKWYDANDKKVKEKVKFGKQNLITYEIMGGIKIGNVKLYAKYNPCNLIDKDFGPDFATWSVGIIL